MKMRKSRFFGLGTKLVLGLALVIGTLTSCYEKEDIKTVIDTTPMTVTYTISGTVYNYANLDIIKGATLTLTNAAGTSVSTTSDDNGGYSIKLEGLTESDRGNYTLSISAAGYKDRTTTIIIWFEKAENQAIATQMDFALKSNDIQGSPVEVVAGKDEQTVEIQGSDEAGQPVTDKIVVPAGLFADGSTQTITVQREGKEEEEASDAIRVYEGKPDGLQFDKPLEFTFNAAAGKNYKVYYEEGGVWKIAEGNDSEVVDNGDGTYTAKIWHFSRFKFAENDYEIAYSNVDTIKNVPALAQESAEYVCHTSSDAVTVAWKRPVYVGYRFQNGTTLEQIFNGCVIKDRAIAEVEAFLKDNGIINLSETADFNTAVQEEGLTTEIPAFYNVTELLLDYSTETLTLTVTIDGISYDVVVEHVKDQTLSFVGDWYDHSHSHGHGDELNAGGGIIDFE